MVRLLEADLGVSLFERTGRRIVLNEAGTTFLVALRDAMRILDDSIAATCGQPLTGGLGILLDSFEAEDLLRPGLCRLRATHPALIVNVRDLRPDEDPNRLLLRGQADLALVERADPDPNLVVERWVELETGIYCGRGHPLFGRRDVALEELLDHDFGVPEHLVGRGIGGWPADVRRRIAVTAPGNLMRDLCRRGAILAVLADRVSQSIDWPLERLAFDLTPPLTIYAVYRESRGAGAKTTAALDVLRGLVADRN